MERENTIAPRITFHNHYTAPSAASSSTISSCSSSSYVLDKWMACSLMCLWQYLSAPVWAQMISNEHKLIPSTRVLQPTSFSSIGHKFWNNQNSRTVVVVALRWATASRHIYQISKGVYNPSSGSPSIWNCTTLIGIWFIQYYNASSWTQLNKTNSFCMCWNLYGIIIKHRKHQSMIYKSDHKTRWFQYVLPTMHQVILTQIY